MAEEFQDLDPAQLADLMEMMRLGPLTGMADATSLAQLAEQHTGIVSQFRGLHPVKTAAAFGGLLTIPGLQANCLRIETLVHFALMFCRGGASPTDSFIRSAFQTLGDGYCGSMEDPAEDVFVSAVRSPRGNFRILEGIWEGSSFYLQRMIDTVESMPPGTGYDDIRDDVYAMLKLSDLVCERSRLHRHQLGQEFPKDKLDAKGFSSLALKGNRVRFSLKELKKADIAPLRLAPFLFTPQDRSRLDDQRLGTSDLERRPIVRNGEDVYLILPTAVSSAIRYYIIQRMADGGMLRALGRGIADEYAKHFDDIQLLGGRGGIDIEFQWTKLGGFAGGVKAVDRGRYFNLVFFSDNLADFDETGLAGMNPACAEMGGLLTSLIDQSYKAASERPDFVDGITLVVGCGIGRGSALMLEWEPKPNWRIEFMSAYDLDTLSWTPEFRALDLWRILDAQDRVASMGTALQNVNGLLNLVAWTRSLDGHLVPHGELPDDFIDGDRTTMLMVTQNGVRKLRHEVAIFHDTRVAQDANGAWVPLRRDQHSDFADDREAPLYLSEIPSEPGLPYSVYLAPARSWWSATSFPDDAPGRIAYERWRLVSVWLRRAAPVLDQLKMLPEGPITWRAVFEAALPDRAIQRPQLSYEEAHAAISVEVNRATRTITTTASKDFDDAIFHPENIAERALVEGLVAGACELAGGADANIPDLLARIAPNPTARHAHAFAPTSFRDFVAADLQRNVIKVNEYDDATARLGLGWQVRERALGGRLNGKEETTAYLNKVVSWVEAKLSADLKQFNREALIKRILLNYEAAGFDQSRWLRTSSAVLALHADRCSTMETISTNAFKLNAVFQASRILIEAAICEAPIDGGRLPGDLDLSRLIATALLLFHYGGWSDAIKWDVMEPVIRITPLGDVHAKLDYIDEIITPHARESSDVRIKDAEESYADNLKQVEGRTSIEGAVDARFLSAWEEEFGTAAQDMRVFVDWLENRGITRHEAIMQMTREDFVDVEAEGQKLSAETVGKLLGSWTLTPRASWLEVPDGFVARDRQPWRFRRRLSLLRRPIILLGPDDGTYLVAPGLIREAFQYVFANYMRGDFPGNQIGPKMRSWAAQQADKRGKRFTSNVAARLEELGWKTQTEVKLTKILRRSLDRDYGDVDVLAWRPSDGRVLIMECKDVQYRKTYGEISEQLADFRGELRPDGKPDYLRRHLDRMDILQAELDGMRSYLGLRVQPTLESHLIFRNPVPMRYALAQMAEKVHVSTFNEVESLN